MICQNCAQTHAKAKGLCSACWAYRQRTGRDRPRRLYQRPTRCKICGCRTKPLYTGRCDTCNGYRHRHGGKERPKQLWEPATRCRNPYCLRPLATCRSKVGYCAACHQYRHRHKHNRPAELCLDPNILGWCECGQPATQAVQVRIGGNGATRQGRTRATLNLCHQCYQFEIA